MDKLVDGINRLLGREHPAPGLTPGIYHAKSPTEGAEHHRYHLRIDSDGNGLLMIDASTILHLNQTAAEIAYAMLQNNTEEEIIERMTARYHIDRDTVLQDYHMLRNMLDSLVHAQDLDPELFLGVERTRPYSQTITAPYRLDCALTYRTNAEVPFSAVSMDRVKRELLCEEWQQVLTKVWNAGIPHVNFTGGEPTLRPDLPDLLAFCQQLGLVTGLVTDGYQITNPEYLQQLLGAGLDHLMILLDPREEQSWEAVLDALNEDIFVTVHLTVIGDDTLQPFQTMDRLAKMGVKSISISGSRSELAEIVNQCGEYASRKGLSLVGDLPVPFSNQRPKAHEFEVGQSLEGAGRAWMYVEPDGDVLPAQGAVLVLGNLLTDDWSTIWNNPERENIGKV